MITEDLDEPEIENQLEETKPKKVLVYVQILIWTVCIVCLIGLVISFFHDPSHKSLTFPPGFAPTVIDTSVPYKHFSCPKGSVLYSITRENIWTAGPPDFNLSPQPLDGRDVSTSDVQGYSFICFPTGFFGK